MKPRRITKGPNPGWKTCFPELNHSDVPGLWVLRLFGSQRAASFCISTRTLRGIRDRGTMARQAECDRHSSNRAALQYSEKAPRATWHSRKFDVRCPSCRLGYRTQSRILLRRLRFWPFPRIAREEPTSDPDNFRSCSPPLLECNEAHAVRRGLRFTRAIRIAAPPKRGHEWTNTRSFQRPANAQWSKATSRRSSYRG